MKTEIGKTEPTLKCKRCFGRGFYLKIGGYTTADRIHCEKCNGLGKVHEYNVKNRKRPHVYYYSKEGVSE
jgi:DnaJ-class molecular chaperone